MEREDRNSYLSKKHDLVMVRHLDVVRAPWEGFAISSIQSSYPGTSTWDLRARTNVFSRSFWMGHTDTHRQAHR